MEMQNVKGTRDIIGGEANSFLAVENLMRQVATLFGFNEVRPPVLEHSELFVRGVGESSDVVRKEMYTFLDKGNRSLTMRPEFTAGIIRLMVQNKLLATSELPLKVYYLGPVFRYERPQLGRYRQFNQFGIESVGSNNPLADVEAITLAYTILQSLSLENVKVKINTLGDEESRNNYRQALKDYFASHIENMCPDCKNRYEINPLRILDCKIPSDQIIVKDAPKMNAFLSDAAKKRFQEVCDALDELQIPYEIDDTLVRGLDYYSETVFEFHYTSVKGNNYGAIGAGGHYDKLVKELGGPNLPGVGFSFGVERIVSVLTDDGLLPENMDNEIDVYVMPVGAEQQIPATIAANAIRMLGYSVDFCFDNVKLGNMFKRAEKKHAKYGLIIGENEVLNDETIIKDLQTKEQYVVKNEDLCDKLVDLIEGQKHTCGCGCHHHDDACQHEHHCDCDCDGKHECGFQPGDFPCVNTGVCPCGENPEDCDCAMTGECECLMHSCEKCECKKGE